MSPQTIDTRAQTVTVRTNRGVLTIRDGHVDGLWNVCRRELWTGARVRKHAGNVPRSTLIYWRTRSAFPAPVLTFPTRGGELELWSRTEVEAWVRQHRQTKTRP